jgi:hypothetical protein
LRRRRIRTRPREVGAVLGAALLVGGCGSGNDAAPLPPRLPAALASRLAARSDTVRRLLRRSDGCGALAAARQLQRDAIAAVNSRRVPTRFQEPLIGAANDLVLRLHCAPSPPPPARAAGHEKRHGKEKHGKGHGKRKHGRGEEGD